MQILGLRDDVSGDVEDDESGAVPDAALPPDESGVWTAADETARGLWARAASGGLCSNPSVTALMMSVAASELVTLGRSSWLWDAGRWWRVQWAREQVGRMVQVELPGRIYDGIQPESQGFIDRTKRVDRRKIAVIYWNAYSGGYSDLRPSRTVTRRALARLESAICDEAGGPRGGLLRIAGGGDGVIERVHESLRKLAGGVRAFRGSGSASYAGDPASRGVRDLQSERIGIKTPAPVVELAKDLHDRVLQAYGVPPGLWHGATTAPREAWRLFVASAVRPMFRPFEGELSRVLGATVSFRWSVLERADRQMLARAVHAQAQTAEVLVRIGVPVREAVMMAGLAGAAAPGGSGFEG